MDTTVKTTQPMKQPTHQLNGNTDSVNALPWRPRLDARSALYLCGGSVSHPRPQPGS